MAKIKKVKPDIVDVDPSRPTSIPKKAKIKKGKNAPKIPKGKQLKLNSTTKALTVVPKNSAATGSPKLLPNPAGNIDSSKSLITKTSPRGVVSSTAGDGLKATVSDSSKTWGGKGAKINLADQLATALLRAKRGRIGSITAAITLFEAYRAGRGNVKKYIEDLEKKQATDAKNGSLMDKIKGVSEKERAFVKKNVDKHIAGLEQKQEGAGPVKVHSYTRNGKIVHEYTRRRPKD